MFPICLGLLDESKVSVTAHINGEAIEFDGPPNPPRCESLRWRTSRDSPMCERGVEFRFDFIPLPYFTIIAIP